MAPLGRLSREEFILMGCLRVAVAVLNGLKVKNIIIQVVVFFFDYFAAGIAIEGQAVFSYLLPVVFVENNFCEWKYFSFFGSNM